jgi:hypothetical protein
MTVGVPELLMRFLSVWMLDLGGVAGFGSATFSQLRDENHAPSTGISGLR